jgi:DMSO/TMAO reductase YedYZ heme-binding membrane subunit
VRVITRIRNGASHKNQLEAAMVKPVAGTGVTRQRSAEQAQERPPTAKNSVDAWMDQHFKFAGSVIKRKTAAVFLLGIPALAPLFFMSRAVIELNSSTMNQVEADVLGTASMALLILTLTITPLVTLTRQHWFVPLRKWYGIMLGCTATADAVLAAITTSFAGGVIGRLTGHTFLLVGFVMVSLLLPLLLISNSRAQQKLTYVIWGLLFLHLALLEGFGFQNGTNGPGSGFDHNPVLHQRLYQLTACSLPLLLLRLRPVKRWVARQQKAGRERAVYLTFLPLAALYVLFFAYIVNEEIFKGVSAFRLQPVNG